MSKQSRRATGRPKTRWSARGWQIIWLLAQGKTTKAIREVTGYCLAWIRTIAHRYNQDGPGGIGDRR
ncbi:MAG TPA: helix-turn-helix domain-containing protein, partial [Ktedonobacteraceae bacterium]|nr:helix-turn-helix domain-containing protein [Ktedonobacteraceae bacterium]